MKNICLPKIACVLLFGFGFCVACSSVGESMTVTSHQNHESHRVTKDFQTVSATKAEPSLYHFVSQSDYVVTAWVSKAKRQPLGQKGNLFAGTVYSFQIEKIFFVKTNSEVSRTNELAHKNFVIFDPGGSDSIIFSEGQKYLIFLEAVPNQAELIEEHELDDNKLYYRVVRSSRYLSHSPPIGFRGIIELKDSESEDFAKSVEVFCEALGESDRSIRLSKLQALTTSKNDILVENAEYVIKLIQSEQ